MVKHQETHPDLNVEGCFGCKIAHVGIGADAMPSRGGKARVATINAKEKPVGLVYIAVATKHEQFCKPFRLFGHREQIIQRSSNAALWMVKQVLKMPPDSMV